MPPQISFSNVKDTNFLKGGFYYNLEYKYLMITYFSMVSLVNNKLAIK